ncbi:MAG: hypothetical protein U9P14_12995 [Gemmatimonadota bacterium]|nr:hypothetical protein [Gemmatimonadota bacterium]
MKKSYWHLMSLKAVVIFCLIALLTGCGPEQDSQSKNEGSMEVGKKAEHIIKVQGKDRVVVDIRGDGPVMQNVAALLIEDISEKSKLCRPVLSGFAEATKADLTIHLEIKPGDKAEGFQIVTGENDVWIRGTDARGVLFGTSTLLDNIIYEKDGFLIHEMDIKESPYHPIRAISYSTTAPCLLPVDKELVKENIKSVKKLIKWGARLKSNTCFFKHKWPQTTSASVSYKYFPLLKKYRNQQQVQACQSYLHELIDYAGSWGMDVYLPFVEFYFPLEALAEEKAWVGSRQVSGRELQPDMNPCPRHPYTRKMVEAKIRETCETFPDIAGIELWMGEKVNSILYCQCERCRDYPPAERFLDLINWVYKTMKSVDPEKKLIIRTYMCAGRCYYEPELFLPIANRLPRDIIIGIKGQYGDFNYLNDPHPLVGAFPNNPQIVEFDLGGEFRGHVKGYFSGISDYTEKRMKLYSEKGTRGFIFRHLDWLNAVTRVDAEAAFTLCWDINESAEEVEDMRLREKFGEEAVPGLKKLRRLGELIVQKDIHIMGANAYGIWGFIPESIFRTRYNVFEHCVRMIKGGEDLLLKAIENPQIALAEKREASDLAKEFGIELERLKDHIPESLYNGLKQTNLLTKKMIELHTITVELFLLYLKYERALYADNRISLILQMRAVIDRGRDWISRNEQLIDQFDIDEIRNNLECYQLPSKSGKPLPRIRRSVSESPVPLKSGVTLPQIHQGVSLAPAKAYFDEVEQRFEKGIEYFYWNIIR